MNKVRSILTAFISNPEVQLLLPYSGRNRYFETSGCLYVYFMALLQPCNFRNFGKICKVSEIKDATGV